MNRMIALSDWRSRCMVCTRADAQKEHQQRLDNRDNNNKLIKQMWLLIAKYSLISGISWVPFCRPWGWCWQRLGIMCCSTLFWWITVEWFTRAWNHQTSNCKFVSTGETYLRAPLLCLGWGGTPLLSLRWRWASTWWNSRLCSRLCRLRYVSHWSTATIRRLPRWSRGTSAIHCCHLCTYKNNTE